MWLWLCSVPVLHQEIPDLVPTNRTRKVFSPRMFAAEMLFHKALSFWSRQVAPQTPSTRGGMLGEDLGILMGPFQLWLLLQGECLNMDREWGFPCLSSARHWASLSPLLCFLGSTGLHPWLQQCQSMMVSRYPSPTQAWVLSCINIDINISST